MRGHVRRGFATRVKRRDFTALLVLVIVFVIIGGTIAYRRILARRRVSTTWTEAGLGGKEERPLDDSSTSSRTDPSIAPVSPRPKARPRRHARTTVAAGLLAVLVAGGVSIVDLPVRGTPHLGAAAAAASPTTSTLPPAPLQVVSTSPASGATAIGLSSDITVQFSAPLADDTPNPTLSPNVPGTWSLVGSSTLMFQPTGYFTPLSKLVLTVPAGTRGPEGRFGQLLGSSYSATFAVAGVPELRLEQLLAELDYLPVQFDPSPTPLPPHEALGHISSAMAAKASGNPLAIDDESTTPNTVVLAAQPGSFSWRYPNMPASLASLWQPGVDTALIQGAIMAFQSDHGLDDNGKITSAFWADLLNAVAARQVNTAPYDYLEVSTALPETLSVWRGGTVIYRSLTNTGIGVAPTALGTYPVYARYVSTTMSGYNPDGSYYDDPGIPDVAYFNGGDAVHGFPRASYGFPQSLGCVELPYSAAAVVFNYDPIGTLVTVS